MAVATSALEKSMCRKIVLSLAVIDSCASAPVLSINSDVVSAAYTPSAVRIVPGTATAVTGMLARSRVDAPSG